MGLYVLDEPTMPVIEPRNEMRTDDLYAGQQRQAISSVTNTWNVVVLKG